jgi:very-short-patch-repair endonuclease
MTPAEEALWALLRTRPCGCKFRRQHPLGPFIADFYCHEVALVIEADGPIHLRRRHRDEQRDRFLALCGIEVLRLTNALILGDSASTARLIERTLLRLLAPLSLRERGRG